jgi:WD40 repeat protein
MTGEINGVIGQHSDSCESIAISSTQPIACSAGIDSKIHVYDLTNFTRRLTVTVGEFGGFTKLIFSQYNNNCLIAASTLGDISLIDPRDGSITKTIKGHVASVNDIKEVKLHDGTLMLATAGDDHQCLVFRQ